MRLALILSALSAGCAVLLAVPTLLGLIRPKLGRTTLRGGSMRLFRRTARRLGPRLPQAFRGPTEKRIGMAGGLDGLTPEQVALASIILGGFAFALGVLLAFAAENFVLPLVFGVLGLVLPSVWLNDRVKARHGDMLRHLPFHLDLLTLAVEAGMDFTAALAKMVEKGKPGPLREEFNHTLSQMRVGVARGQALREMAARVDLPQLTTFLLALVQADKLGMSIGKVLRVQSETVRTERSQRAEKRANEAPVRILIPLIVFIFPTIWIILFAPIVFSFAF